MADMAQLSIGVSDMQVNADEDEILGAIEVNTEMGSLEVSALKLCI